MLKLDFLIVPQAVLLLVELSAVDVLLLAVHQPELFVVVVLLFVVVAAT